MRSTTAPIAWVFPGQGSQQVGMGHQLAQTFPQVAHLYSLADKTLNLPLSRLCFEGPEEVLTHTGNAQPALLTTSIAVLLALGGSLDQAGRFLPPPDLPSPRFVAGHSLGEYTALVAAGALPFPQALRLVRERGRLMAEARDGSMAAVIGMEETALEEIVRQVREQFGPHTPLVIANYNCPGQLVLSGAVEPLRRAMEEAQKKGAHRVIPLKVSAAFHSPLMQAAAEGLAQALAGVEFDRARIPVIANTTAQPIRQPEEMRSELVTQVCTPVRWSDTIHYLAAQGINHFWEIGPGTVLSGLIRRTLPESQRTALSTPEQVQALREEFSQATPGETR